MTDPWELLSAASRNIPCVRLHYTGGYACDCTTCKLRNEIVNALAEHNSTTDIVEWSKVNENFSTAYPDIQTSLTVSRFDLTQQKWRWDAEVEIKKAGYCDTEEEAKAAALKAARGLK